MLCRRRRAKVCRDWVIVDRTQNRAAVVAGITSAIQGLSRRGTAMGLRRRWMAGGTKAREFLEKWFTGFDGEREGDVDFRYRMTEEYNEGIEMMVASKVIPATGGTLEGFCYWKR